MAQINQYEEESKEDWAELRWLNLSEAEGGLHAAAASLIRALGGVWAVEEVVLDLLQRMGISLGRDVDE